jgi:hypothetical protein
MLMDGFVQKYVQNPLISENYDRNRGKESNKRGMTSGESSWLTIFLPAGPTRRAIDSDATQTAQSGPGYGNRVFLEKSIVSPGFIEVFSWKSENSLAFD